MRDRVGEVLDGKFRLLRLIGSGGMGSVYEGEHLEIGKRVAVKFMHAEFAKNPEAVRRFHQEARAAAAAGHPGIVDIYDIGRAPDGAPYLVMELLSGESVGALLLRERSLPVSLAVAIARGALSALSAAHKKGVVHRDIKPDNIFLEQTSSEGPSVKLLDFGVSKMSQMGVPSATVEGTALGTPHYMAPEQARGELTLDARVDVYAMGVILYEMLGGALPFEAANTYALVLKVVSDPPRPLRDLRPDLPEALEAVVGKAMAKAPADRFATAEELAEALRPFRDDGGVTTSPGLGGETPRSAGKDTPTPRTWVTEAPVALPGAGRWRWIAAGLASLALVGLVTYYVAGKPTDVVEARWTGAGATPAPAPAPPAPAAPVPAAPAPAAGDAPSSVAITLEGAPADARVFLDDARVPQLPIRIPRGEVMRRVRVEVDGRAPYSTMVVPDRDQTIIVTLGAEPGKNPRTPGQRRGIFRDTSEFDR